MALELQKSRRTWALRRTLTSLIGSRTVTPRLMCITGRAGTELRM